MLLDKFWLIANPLKTDNNLPLAISDQISAIRAERDIDERIRMLHRLNNLLPADRRLEFPSLITNAYIRKALDIILERATVKP
jgi:hypothetical protein